MTNKNRNMEFDELIKQSIQLSDTPSAQLNCNLKASLYKQEAALKQSVKERSISLWYLPMILNFTLFTLFAICFILLIANIYFAVLIASICGYIALSGVAITVIGVKRTKLKEDMSIYVQKRGALA